METVIVLRDPWTARSNGAHGGIRVRSRRSSSGSRPRVEVERVDRRGRSELLAEPDVMAVSPAMPTRLIEPRSVRAVAPEPGTAWGVAAVRATESAYSGHGVVVAVLDTGIEASHRAFDDLAVVQRSFVDRPGSGDANGHGTHCAGVVVGRDVDGTRIGVARGVRRLLAAQVLADDGVGTSDALFEGIMWSLEEGAQVISVSLGLDFPGMVQELAADGWPVALATSRALEAYGANLRMLDRLMDLVRARQPFGQGAVVVAAAGNESRRDERADYAIAASLPGAAAGVLSVGAAARLGGGDRLGVAPFSNAFPTVCAPGVEIVSARQGGDLVAMSGTSMACPHVAGVAALWWEAIRHEGLPVSPETVVAKLLATADVHVFDRDNSPADRGAGLVTAP